MRILRQFLIERGSRLILCALSSLCHGLTGGLVFVITSEVLATRGFGRPLWAFGFIGMVLIAQALRYTTNVLILREVESLGVSIRLRVLRALAGCPYDSYEAIGEARIHTSLTSDCAAVARFIPDFVELLSAAFTMLVCGAYLLWLSPLVFLLMVVTAALGSSLYLLRQHATQARFAEARSQDAASLRNVLEFLHGFKELTVNAPKRVDILDRTIEPGLRRARDLRVEASRLVQLNFSIGLCMVFAVVGIVLFVLPGLRWLDESVISRIVVVLVYTIVPGGAFMYSWLQMAGLRVALDNLSRLLSDIESRAVASGATPTADPAGLRKFDDFRALTFEDVFFQYESVPRFAIGPLSLAIRRGGITAVMGGNGGGKTSLIRVLTGLYSPQRGRILVDGEPVSEEDRAAYRYLFAPVFSDFHLFDRFYGVAAPEEGRVSSWLKSFNLDSKVTVTGNALSTISLSAGQRRRLALLTALVDDRPILVFDEMTADQESGFRDYFYDEFLPSMKRSGKTVVLVTHDARAVEVADHTVRMDYGTLAEALPDGPPRMNSSVSRRASELE